MSWNPRKAAYPGQAKPSKYRNKKVEFDGHTFDSGIEKAYYSELLLRKAAGEVTNILVHPRYKIEINGCKICTVVLDFEFMDHAQKRLRYVDVKGMYLAESKLRHKLLAAVKGICIEVLLSGGKVERIEYDAR